MAAGTLLDPDRNARRFAAEVLHSLAIDPAPSRAEALTTLRSRLTAEQDAGVLASLIAANRDDPDPRVRPEVLLALSQGGDREACAELTRLGAEAGEGSALAVMASDAKRWILKATPP